jgi:hypothetical protein
LQGNATLILAKMLSGNILQTILPELTFDLQMLEKLSNICSILNAAPSLGMNYASLLHQNNSANLIKILKKQKFPKAAMHAILN